MLALAAAASIQAQAPDPTQDDWLAFRGTDGSASSESPVPIEWDEDAVTWRMELPGRGSSSPIVLGDSIYVTCWSGYALDTAAPGNPGDLKRHLLRVDRRTGEILWTVTLDRAANEDPYEGRMANHGFASGTPVSDGGRLYVFFGKAGMFAFDLDGNQLWHSEVGSSSSQWNTGSGSSPTLWKDRLFINASDESEAILALDAATGEQLWSRSSRSLDQAYDTPVVTEGDDPVVLFAFLGGVWGLSPQDGELLWSVKTRSNGAMAPSIIVDGDVAYSLGGQTGTRAYAIRLGGSGDITDSHVLWSSRNGSYVSTPLLFEGHLYWVDEGGIAYCTVAETGELVYRERLEGMFYASVVRAGDTLYATSRENGTFVYPASPEFRLLAHNMFEDDDSVFHATPALSGGQIFLRSDRYLYCVGR